MCGNQVVLCMYTPLAQAPAGQDSTLCMEASHVFVFVQMLARAAYAVMYLIAY